MTTEQRVATIEFDGEAWEPKYDVTVYDRGRLIHVMKKVDESPRLLPIETEQEAREALATYYPGVPLITDWRKFEQYYEDQGYYYPPTWSRETDLLCHKCQTPLKLQQRSIGAGRNAPSGALITMFYDCPGCHRIYCDQRQEFTSGWSSIWSYEEPGENQFTECADPAHIPNYNPHGFRETHLHQKKEQA